MAFGVFDDVERGRSDMDNDDDRTPAPRESEGDDTMVAARHDAAIDDLLDAHDRRVMADREKAPEMAHVSLKTMTDLAASVAVAKEQLRLIKAIQQVRVEHLYAPVRDQEVDFVVDHVLNRLRDILFGEPAKP